jgi:hypothetical protein
MLGPVDMTPRRHSRAISPDDFRIRHSRVTVTALIRRSRGNTDAAPRRRRSLHDLFGGARNAPSESLYGRYPFDTGIAQTVWRQMHLSTSATAQSNASDVILGVEALRYYMLTPPTPSSIR